ncbi:MAG: hypothetical protein SVP26_00660 [Chloroflexota bacterium]|nr:hypothetical protein [Chloroflexota bacterium]
MNEERINKLETVYRLFFDKSQELLLFFYWTDQFYSGARGEIGDHAVQLESAKQMAETAWGELRRQGASQGDTVEEIGMAWDRAVNGWQGVASDLEGMRRQLLCTVALVYMVALFEAFFADSAAVLLIRRQSDKIGRCAFSRQVRYLEKTLHVSLDTASVNLRLCELDEVFARRNLLLHCGGIVDERYLKRVGASHLSAGDEAAVDERYFLKAAYGFQSLARYLCRVLIARSKELDADDR